MVTLLEFRGALLRASQTREYKRERAADSLADSPLSKKRNRDLFVMADAALAFFTFNHKLLKDLRNAVGGISAPPLPNLQQRTSSPMLSGSSKSLSIRMDAEVARSSITLASWPPLLSLETCLE